MLCSLFPALIAATAIAPPSALADSKFAPQGRGPAPSGKEGWGKPQYPPSGPHPGDTVNKSTVKHRSTNQ
ncbi:hypothetical protein G3N57_26655 [Paraburkholderia sp. Se-20369]|nr:hypothetical protein [Paraburkholderia sp. Se-20369]TCW79711.1 hypothetical protein C5O80_29585 [Burkholderia sp. SRS-46]